MIYGVMFIHKNGLVLTAIFDTFLSVVSLFRWNEIHVSPQQIAHYGLIQPMQVAQMNQYGGVRMPSVRYSTWIRIWINFA